MSLTLVVVIQVRVQGLMCLISGSVFWQIKSLMVSGISTYLLCLLIYTDLRLCSRAPWYLLRMLGLLVRPLFRLISLGCSVFAPVDNPPLDIVLLVNSIWITQKKYCWVVTIVSKWGITFQIEAASSFQKRFLQCDNAQLTFCIQLVDLLFLGKYYQP